MTMTARTRRFLIWSRLRSRVLGCLERMPYEEASNLAEYIVRELTDAPELVITLGEWPTEEATDE